MGSEMNRGLQGSFHNANHPADQVAAVLVTTMIPFVVLAPRSGYLQSPFSQSHWSWPALPSAR